MKKIVFCLQTMILGGVEKELITVLKKIHEKFDITLLLLYLEDTEIIKCIPNNVKIKVLNIDKNYYCSGGIELIKQRVKNGKLFEAISIFAKRCFKIGTAGSNININDIFTLNENFDVAICYHIHSPIMFKYVAQKIIANKKVAWIHNDFYTTKFPIWRLKKYVNCYDEFVSVSRKVENEFRNCCPWYNGSISTAYNYLDVSEILDLSEQIIKDDNFIVEENIKILTVGRFDRQKGIDLAIVAASKLKKEGLNFNWFLIGYGELENFYRELIREYGVSDCFTILGKKTNPYPYIKKCDIYVQPSRHEAFGLVIKEAKILKRPIICTNFDGADEQIETGKNGIIVPCNDVGVLCKEISKMILSAEVRENLTAELEKWHPDDDLKEIVKHLE